jgi:hypothetical protein
MPKNTRLKICVGCQEEPARVGVYRSYYVLGGHRSRPASPEGSEPQVKGSFRARGYCSDCFLKLAEKNGIEESRLKQLRHGLQ